MEQRVFAIVIKSMIDFLQFDLMAGLPGQPPDMILTQSGRPARLHFFGRYFPKSKSFSKLTHYDILAVR